MESEHKPRRYAGRLILLAAVVAALLWVGWYFAYGPGEPVRVPVEKLTAAGTQDIVEAKLELLNSPRISRAHGRPEVLAWGSDDYSYKGKIAIDGDVYRFSSRSMAPVAALRYDGELYVLTRAYFIQSRFGFRVPNADKTFVSVKPLKVPEALRYLHFDDDNDAYFYKLWWLNELVDAGRVDDAAACFNAYVSENPRFAFRSNWHVRETHDVEFVDFTLEAIRGRRCLGFYDGLVELVRHSQPTDDPQAVRFACAAVLELKPVEGGRFLLAFKREVEQEGIPDDARADAFSRPFAQPLPLEDGSTDGPAR